MSFELRELWKSAGGRIPDEWNIVSLESLLQDSKSIAVGVMYPGPETLNGVPLIKVGDIKGGCIPVKPAFCISAETNHEYRRSQLIGDELLITLVGNPGECVIVTPQMAGWNAARAIAVVKLKDVGLRTYIKTVLESSAGKHLIDSVLNTTVQKTLNLKDIRRLPIPIPANSTIKNISKFSEALSDRITLLRETNATLEAIAQALFKSWFVDFDPVRAKSEGKLPEGIDEATAALFPDSFEQSKLGEIPKGWKISNIGSELTTILGGTPSRERPEFWNDGVVSWINSGKVNEFRITTASELITEEALLKSATKLLPARTTVIAITGATLGQVSIVEIEACTNQSVVGLIQNEKFSTEYIYFWINFNIKKLISSQTGGAQQHINKGNVEDLHFLVPDIKILNKFKSISHPLFLKVAENCFQISTLGNIRDTLLPRLISGQLGLPDLDEINNKIKVKA